MGITTGDEAYVKTVDWFNSLTQEEYDALATRAEKEMIASGFKFEFPETWLESVKNAIIRFKEKK